MNENHTQGEYGKLENVSELIWPTNQKKKTRITPGLTLKDKLGDVAGAGSLVVKNKL